MSHSDNRVTSIYTSKMSVSLSLTTTNSYMYILTCTLSDMHFLFVRNNSVTSNKICLLKGVSPRDPITCYNLFQQSSYINNYKLIPGAVLGRYMIHGADVGGIWYMVLMLGEIWYLVLLLVEYDTWCWMYIQTYFKYNLKHPTADICMVWMYIQTLTWNTIDVKTSYWSRLWHS